MPLLLSALRLYYSTVTPDDDTVLAIGGVISKIKRPSFSSASGSVQILSSSAADTVPTIAISGRDATGAIVSETHALNGTTPVLFSTNWNRLLKAIKSQGCAGDVIVEEQVAVRSNTAVAGSAFDITLDAGASAVDDFYDAMVIRITAGTGTGQIRQIINYVGATKVASVDHSWATPPDATSVFRIAQGYVFEKVPFEVFEVRRPFYNAFADVPSGVAKTYFEKAFWENRDQTLSLTSSQAIKFADPAGVIDFGLEANINGGSTNGGGNNRQVTPAGVVFDSIAKNIVAGGNPAGLGVLQAGSDQGIWFRLSLAAGAAGQDTTFTPALTGQTS
jgi:hypothetical protein